MTRKTDLERLRNEIRTTLANRDKIEVPSPEQSSSGQKSDDAALNEATAFSEGDLEKQSERNEHDRTERFRNHVSVAILIVFWLGFIALVGAAAAWVVHFMLPQKEILSAAQADRIISFLTGGGLTSFVAGYAKKRLT